VKNWHVATWHPTTHEARGGGCHCRPPVESCILEVSRFLAHNSSTEILRCTQSWILKKRFHWRFWSAVPSESWHARHHDSLHCHQWRPSVRIQQKAQSYMDGWWKRWVPVMMRIGPLTSHFYTRCFILLPTLVVLQFTWREDLFQLAIAIWKSLCCMFITSIVEEIDPPPPQQERVDDMAFAYSCGEICPSLHCVILEVLLIYITCACSITWWRTLRVAKQGRLAGRQA
jgi:hypothetical protein